MTTYEVHKTKDGTQFYWVQKAANGETLATSETYERLRSAIDGAIASGASVPVQYVGKDANGS